jgi:hypothetical protein
LTGGTQDKMPRLKRIESKVNEIMEAIPETRDDDNLLLCTFLKSDEDYDELVLKRIMEDRIATRFKSVERCRRKLQRENPKLRGSAWERRHEAAEEFKNYSME